MPERVAEVYSGHARGYADFWSPIIRPVALMDPSNLALRDPA